MPFVFRAGARFATLCALGLLKLGAIVVAGRRRAVSHRVPQLGEASHLPLGHVGVEGRVEHRRALGGGGKSSNASAEWRARGGELGAGGGVAAAGRQRGSPRRRRT